MSIHEKKRGVIVYTAPFSEIHTRVGIYTRDGLVYAMAYGQKSQKSKLKNLTSLFVMGQFMLEKNKKNFYKISDVYVYDNCYSLSQNLSFYYAACVCAEIVKFLQGIHHRFQFKITIDALLYLSKHSLSLHENNVTMETVSKSALCVFLWRSLDANGWCPAIVLEKNLQSDNSWKLHSESGMFSIAQNANHGIPSHILLLLQASNNQTFSEIIQALSTFNYIYIKQTLYHLLHHWQYLLERKLYTAQFVL